MKTGEMVVQALDLLMQHEKAIGRLYAAYAERFPQDRKFWLGLSQEEDHHAECIESLRPRIESDPTGLVVARFPTAAIGHSIAYVNRLIDQADHPSLTRVNAFSAAMDIETALLENKYFEVFAGDSPPLRRTLEILDRGTRTHLQKVRQFWESAVRSRV